MYVIFWSCGAGYTGAILSAFGLVGFLGLRPPGLAWALVFVLPMTALMVGALRQSLHP